MSLFERKSGKRVKTEAAASAVEPTAKPEPKPAAEKPASTLHPLKPFGIGKGECFHVWHQDPYRPHLRYCYHCNGHEGGPTAEES